MNITEIVIAIGVVSIGTALGSVLHGLFWDAVSRVVFAMRQRQILKLARLALSRLEEQRKNRAGGLN